MPILHQLLMLTSPLGIVSTVLGSLFLMYLADRIMFRMPYPPGMPLVREPEGARRFSLRTRLGYYIDCESLFRDAYENYSKKGKPVVIPGLGSRKEVLLPPNSMRWVLAQPADSLSVGEAFAEINQVGWSLGDKRVVTDAWQALLVNAEMNRVLENVCAAMNDELKYAVDACFGTVTESWKELHLMQTIGHIVAQAASRFTVGLPLCRNLAYLRTCQDINQLLVANAGVSGATPTVLKPLVGTLFNLPMRFKLSKLKKWLVPLWTERLEMLRLAHDNPNHKQPQDHIQMMVRYAEKERPHELHDYPTLTRRLATQNFGAMHQTTILVTNLILNILGSDAEFNTISKLRDETKRILDTNGDSAWTKTGIRQMIRADSVARETLRLNSFGGRAIVRKVMVDNFETGDGYHIPKGTVVSFFSQPAHTDGENFEDPLKFDPFRFSRPREMAAGRDEQSQAVSFVTTGVDYLPFGHGKHACPGRFLVDFEVKMIIAYVLRHYDLELPKEYGGQRPPNYWVTEALYPPDGARVMVKRRNI